jgi:DNA-binding NarL/FixJ family response regulator
MRSVFIVGRDDFLLSSMRVVLGCAAGVNVVGVLDDDAGVLDALREAEPDIVLIDAGGSPDRALDHLHEVCTERPDALVVLVAAELDADLLDEAAERGALVCVGAPAIGRRLQGLLATEERRPAAHLRLAVPDRATPADERAPELDCPLTARELEVLRAVAEGHTNARIGQDLWLTEQTVKFHLSKIYRKLQVSNRTEASRYVLPGGPFAARAPLRVVGRR